MRHIGFDDVEAELIDHLSEFVGALTVGGDLRLDIPDVLAEIAHRVECSRQQFGKFSLPKTAPVQSLKLSI